MEVVGRAAAKVGARVVVVTGAVGKGAATPGAESGEVVAREVVDAVGVIEAVQMGVEATPQSHPGLRRLRHLRFEEHSQVASCRSS